MQAFSPNLEPVISFSCAEQRFVIQIKSKSSIFLLWIMLLALYLRILYPILDPKDFLWFSSEGFIVLHFISKSVISFELILYKIWGLGQSFFLLCYFNLLLLLLLFFFCLQMHNYSSLFVEDCPFYSQLLLHLCKNQVEMFAWDMSRFFILFHWAVLMPPSTPYSLDYCSCRIKLNIGENESSHCSFFFLKNQLF